jgi:glycosyltransferase involved in cell wall biosynthesis
MKKLFDFEIKSGISPIVSVVIPIFNQQEIVYSNLVSLVDSMCQPFELILLNDASEDLTHREIIRFISEAKENEFSISSLVKIVYLRSFFISIFETKCDVIGFQLAKAPYILELQADMKILEKNFDKKLIKALEQNVDLIAISGRSCQTFKEAFKIYTNSIKDFGSLSQFIKRIFKVFLSFFFDLIFTGVNETHSNLTEPTFHKNKDMHTKLSQTFPVLPKFIDSGRAGYLDESIEDVVEINSVSIENSTNIFISETVSRGPLLFSRQKYKEVGGFDQDIFFLGFDDHDLFYRALLTHGYKTAFVPVSFESKLSNSSNLKKRSLKQSLILEFLRYTKTKKFRRNFEYWDFRSVHHFGKEIRCIK